MLHSCADLGNARGESLTRPLMLMLPYSGLDIFNPVLAST